MPRTLEKYTSGVAPSIAVPIGVLGQNNGRRASLLRVVGPLPVEGVVRNDSSSHEETIGVVGRAQPYCIPDDCSPSVGYILVEAADKLRTPPRHRGGADVAETMLSFTTTPWRRHPRRRPAVCRRSGSRLSCIAWNGRWPSSPVRVTRIPESATLVMLAWVWIAVKVNDVAARGGDDEGHR